MMDFILSGIFWSIIVAGSLTAFVTGGDGSMLALFIIGVLGLVHTGRNVVRWGQP